MKNEDLFFKKNVLMKEQKDVRQRIEEGEFAQSAEISASYLDEDILDRKSVV